jgi:prepilin-type N-terminal cleavage/methylation domain-containing protein
MKLRNQKGFTLMELMVVIVIVAILAAVAVPLYINYVRDAQRTEARGAIGAIITAEQVHLQRFGAYIGYTPADFRIDPATDTRPASARLDVDVREATQNWDFTVTLGGDPQAQFTITANGLDDRPTQNINVTYAHDRANPPPDPWTDN